MGIHRLRCRWATLALAVPLLAAAPAAPAGPRSTPLRKVDGKTRAVSTWLY